MSFPHSRITQSIISKSLSVDKFNIHIEKGAIHRRRVVPFSVCFQILIYRCVKPSPAGKGDHEVVDEEIIDSFAIWFLNLRHP